MSDFLQPHGLQPARLLCPCDFPGKNIGVGCHFFLQGISSIQGSNLDLLHCRQILYCLSHQGRLNLRLGFEKSGPFHPAFCFSQAQSLHLQTDTPSSPQGLLSQNLGRVLPLWSGGEDSTLSIQGAQVQPLSGEDSTCCMVWPKQNQHPNTSQAKNKQTKNLGRGREGQRCLQVPVTHAGL